MRRLAVLVLMALAACGGSDETRGAATPEPFCPLPEEPRVDFVVGLGDEPQGPPNGIARHLLSVGAFREMQSNLETATQGFDAAVVANALTGAEWVVATDIMGNRIVAEPAQDGGYPTVYRLDSGEGETWGRFVMGETASGIWVVQEAQSFCSEQAPARTVAVNVFCPLPDSGPLDYGIGPDSRAQLPPEGLARHLLGSRAFKTLQDNLVAAAPAFDSAVAANAGSGNEWVVATDAFGNQIVASPAEAGGYPTLYFLESPQGEVFGRFVMGELSPGEWVVTESQSFCH